MLTDNESTRRQAARGVLLGAACGDAVGAPFEGSRTVSRMLVENWVTSSGPLRYTDDTAMTLVLARHLIASGTIDEDRLARDFAEAWQAEPDRGYGAGPPRIFRAVLAGEGWATAARDAFGGSGSWGNGGAMRVAPVAFLLIPLSERVRMARGQAAVTHAHPWAQDGAALQCAAIAHAAATAGERLNAEGFCAALREHVTTPEFHDALDGVRDLAHAGASQLEIGSRLGADITALGSVPAAIAHFLSNPDELEATLVSAVLAGGDTDTIASMAGALGGARLGDRGLSPSLVRRLENHHAIIKVADALASLSGTSRRSQ